VYVAASVFLSYASDDRQAARAIGDALTGFGLDVWLDESELGGGDAWDQKIRRQIRECDYFMPIVSARTEARPEGYFRREWRLAVERTFDMADDHLFLLPVVIDGTDETRARVPEKFLAVQWLRLPGGQPTPALEALCRRIASGGAPEPQAAKQPQARPVVTPPSAQTRAIPPFPREEPGQRGRFWAHALGWVFHAAWLYVQRLPRWIRWILYVWGAFFLVSHCVPSHHRSADPSADQLKRLKAITDQYQGTNDPGDVAKLGAQISHEFSDELSGRPAHNPILAIPFAAPAGDSAGAKLADTAFAQTYGRLAMSRHGHVDLNKDSGPSSDRNAAVERARANHASYVVYGAVAAQSSGEVLTVTVAAAEDGTVVWTQSYPSATADPSKIAAEVDSKVPTPESD
jgi:TolB-like protein